MAGVFFASQIGYFNPDNFVLNNSILVVAYVVFGGMGSLPGRDRRRRRADLAARVPQGPGAARRTARCGSEPSCWLMMIFRPAGLIPAKRRKAELAGLDGVSSAETRAVPVSEGI